MSGDWQSDVRAKRLNARYASERRFKFVGLAAIVLSMLFLAFLLFTMLKNGLGGLDWSFLTLSDATDPDQAGIWGAAKGSLFTMAVTLLLSFPLGVLSAIYLEEFAPRKSNAAS